MSQYDWESRPTPVRRQAERLQREIEAAIGSGLLGVYLHGSLAMGCFNPMRSDLDLLAVTQDRIALDVKRTLAQAILRLSRNPIPVEISFLCRADMLPWRYPTPFDLHYSEDWRERFERDLATGHWKAWDSQERHDPDLAAHITITRARGVRLSGAAIEAVFPEVPAADYLDSVLGDVQAGLQALGEHPVYGILNACRTAAYLAEGRLYSKDEGGVWGERHLPAALRSVVLQALEAYRGESADVSFSPKVLEAFAREMRGVLAGGASSIGSLLSRKENERLGD